VWPMMERRAVRRGNLGFFGNPWLLSAVGLAAASYLGMRIWRRV